MIFIFRDRVVYIINVMGQVKLYTTLTQNERTFVRVKVEAKLHIYNS